MAPLLLVSRQCVSSTVATPSHLHILVVSIAAFTRPAKCNYFLLEALRPSILRLLCVLKMTVGGATVVTSQENGRKLKGHFFLTRTKQTLGVKHSFKDKH